MAMPYHVGDEPLRGFKLVHSLGTGSRGEVWQAAHVSGLTAALKIIPLHDQDAGRWLPAILEIKNIRHPNVWEISRTWLRDTKGNLFGLTQARPRPGWDLVVVMELGAQSLGHRLQESLKSQTPGIERPELMDLMHAAAKGIDYLTGQGVIHEVRHQAAQFLLHGGKVRVTDMGQAGLSGDDREANEQVKIGNRAYSSAEALRNTLHPNSDQYSLAICYYQLRTGKLPYKNAASASEVEAAIVGGRLFPGDLPEGEQPVFAQATQLDPDQRYSSAAPSSSTLYKSLKPMHTRHSPAARFTGRSSRKTFLYLPA